MVVIFFCWLGGCVCVWTLVGINECLIAKLQALLHMCAFTFFMIEISIKTNRGQNYPWLNQTNHSCQKIDYLFLLKSLKLLVDVAILI